jgi:hypothetical protein
MPWFVRAVALFAALCGARAWADVSTTPYITLFTVLAPAQQINSFDRLRAVQRIDSKTPGVVPSQIRIVVKAKRGDIAVPVAADGHIDFPLDEALKTENPEVQTNQPKGSLSLTVTMELKLPAGLHIAWADLHAALDQAHAVLAAQAHTEGLSVPGIIGAEFRFGRGTDARVTVTGKSERLLAADAQGRVIVMLDEAAAKEQPNLEFTHQPLAVMPFLQDSK